jgi:hypothetical protein
VIRVARLGIMQRRNDLNELRDDEPIRVQTVTQGARASPRKKINKEHTFFLIVLIVSLTTPAC